MSSVDADQVSGTVGASRPGGVVGASQVGGTVGARLAQPQANLWTPAELDGLALWLDVWDSPFDLRTDGGTDYVTRWGDLSGNENDAVQSTGSAQPSLGTNAVFFDGSSYLASELLSVAQPFTAFTVCKINGEKTYERIWDGIAGGRALYGKQKSDIAIFAGSVLSASSAYPTSAMGGWHL
jgi:hypothetical protein